MKNNRSFLFFILSFLLFILSACSPIIKESSDSSSEMDVEFIQEEQTFKDSEKLITGEIGLDLGEKIIENAWLSYETTHFNETIDFVNEQITLYEGVLERSSRGQSSSAYGFIGEYLSMTIRIPHDSLDSFINELKEYDGLYLQSEEIERVDVTKIFRDNETRIAVLAEEEEALRNMLQEQGSLEEILQIRTRLAEVIAEREIYENDNNYYNEQASFSSIDLHIQQADRAHSRDVSGFGDRLNNAFIDSFYRFIAVAQDLIVGLVYLLPYLAILFILVILFYYLFQKYRKNKQL